MAISPRSGAHDGERNLLLSASKGLCCQKKPRTLCSWEVGTRCAVRRDIPRCHHMPSHGATRPGRAGTRSSCRRRARASSRSRAPAAMISCDEDGQRTWHQNGHDIRREGASHPSSGGSNRHRRASAVRVVRAQPS